MIVYVVLNNGNIIAAFINKKSADDLADANNNEYVRYEVKPVHVQDAQSMPDHA